LHGRLILAANKTVSSSVMRFGSKCRLAIKLYDLRKAATEKTASIKCKCDVESISDAIDRAVVRLGGVAPAGGLRGTDKAAPSVEAADNPCIGGKVLVAGHCCWPGQDWGMGSGKCIGKPQCPVPLVLRDNECKQSAYDEALSLSYSDNTEEKMRGREMMAGLCDAGGVEACMTAGLNADSDEEALRHYSAACDLGNAKGCKKSAHKLDQMNRESESVKYWRSACSLGDKGACDVVEEY